MAKFHISEDGVPRSCNASEGNCPLGGENDHFSTKVMARAAYEARQDAATVAPSLQKKKSRDELREEAAAAAPREWETKAHEPELEYVNKELDADQLGKGSYYEDEKLGRVLVLEAKNGTKNTNLVVKTEDGKEKRVGFNRKDKVTSEVAQETAASKERAKKVYTEQSYEQKLGRYEPQRAKALAEITLAVSKGHQVSSHRWGSLMEADANDFVMADYERVVSSVKERTAEGVEGFEDEKFPYTRAFEILKERYTKEIVAHASRGVDRSTYGVSNDAEAILIGAKSKLLDSYSWGW